MNAIFPFTRTAFKCLCIVVLFLFGGVSVQHKSISLGATSCYATTVNRLPAKGKADRKLNRLYSGIRRFLKHKLEYIRDYNIAGWLVIIIPIAILLAGSIVFSVWAFNLFVASKVFGGFLAMLVGCTLLYLVIKWPKSGWNMSQ